MNPLRGIAPDMLSATVFTGAVICTKATAREAPPGDARGVQVGRR
jgi:hypothetical protein